MTLTLRLYDAEGTEIGWFRAIRDPDAELGEWGEPYRYDWGMAESASGEWDELKSKLRWYADPMAFGSVEYVETEEVTMHFEGMVRLDGDGPEAYLEQVAVVAEQMGVSRTTIEGE